MSMANRMPPRATVRAIQTLALLALCAAYLQGGVTKALDFDAAIAEMRHFGLQPAAPMALSVILLELVASVLVIAGWYRWLGALSLALFTLAASVVANPFWAMAGEARFMATNAFFEHIGLAGGLVLVAWHDLLHGRHG